MAVYWSWAWGPETLTQLKNEMGFSSTSGFGVNPDSNTIYTYIGSPTRYSMKFDVAQQLRTPASSFVNKGWVCVPFYAESPYTATNSRPIISVDGNTQQVLVYCSNVGTAELSLRMFENTGFNNSTFVISGTYANDQWHYLALKYDITLASTTAEVWINGSQQLVATASYSSAVVSTSGEYRTVGFSDSSSKAYIGQIVVYDTGSLSSGNPYDSIYCTRANPTIDETGVGTFTPSTGVDNYAVLDAPFDSSIFTANTSSNVGDKVVCQVSGTSGFYSQIGTSPDDIRGVTVHGWASGSGQNAFVGISNDNSTYDNGGSILPDVSTPTYAYATAADQPSDSNPWNTGSLLYIKYEVS